MPCLIEGFPAVLGLNQGLSYATTELHRQPNFLKLLSSLIRQKVHLHVWAEASTLPSAASSAAAALS